jgi:uncharacterized repeat protein (TIGR03803 family)
MLALLAVALMLPAGIVAASTYKVLHRFTGPDGANPLAGLIFDGAGNLYGTTRNGGSTGLGTVFRLVPNADGTWKESVLYSFSPADGDTAVAALSLDTKGNLYGTTAFGGGGTGVVFQLKPNAHGSWTEAVLHSFSGPDGLEPGAGSLIFDAAGNIYGTTLFGGSGLECGSVGCGVVFKLTPNADGTWKETILHSFCSLTSCTDGAEPDAGLLFDAAGNIYGTTLFGGSSSACVGSPPGCGVVFKLTPHTDGSWTERVLHRFTESSDGGQPDASLIFDAAGILYGTTLFGGSGCRPRNCGIVFKLTPHTDGSWTESVLHAFQDHPAAQPTGALSFDAAGNLYGTASNGRSVSGFGAVFRLAPKSGGGWTYTVPHTFLTNSVSYPYGSLALDKAGIVYGTASDCDGGNNCFGDGVVFEVMP